jgi:hypothetical protein
MTDEEQAALLSRVTASGLVAMRGPHSSSRPLSERFEIKAQVGRT